MYNKIIIVGHLTRDIELRYMPSGSAVATLGIASSHRYTKQDGTKAEETCFVDVKMFGRSAEIANQYLRKGSKVLIDGRLNLETWSDQSGQKRSKHVIIAESMKMLDSKTQSEQRDGHQNYGTEYEKESHGANQNHQAPKVQASKESYAQQIPEINIDDEDIPF